MSVSYSNFTAKCSLIKLYEFHVFASLMKEFNSQKHECIMHMSLTSVFHLFQIIKVSYIKCLIFIFAHGSGRVGSKISYTFMGRVGSGPLIGGSGRVNKK